MHLSLAALLLVGCPHHRLLCVEATDTSADGLTLQLGQGRSCADTPTVREVVVQGSDDGRITWRLSHPDGLPLRELRYGVVPDGFEAARPAVPLEPGARVHVGVHGPGEQGGADVTIGPAAAATPAAAPTPPR